MFSDFLFRGLMCQVYRRVSPVFLFQERCYTLFPTDLGGYYIYLFHRTLCVNVQRHFLFTTFVCSRGRSQHGGFFFFFFLNKRHFWTSSPLNDYKWIGLAGTTGSFYKIWQEISLTGICMAQFVLFVSSTQCPRVNRPIARHKEQGQNITSRHVRKKEGISNIHNDLKSIILKQSQPYFPVLTSPIYWMIYLQLLCNTI